MSVYILIKYKNNNNYNNGNEVYYKTIIGAAALYLIRLIKSTINYSKKVHSVSFFKNAYVLIDSINHTANEYYE